MKAKYLFPRLMKLESTFKDLQKLESELISNEQLADTLKLETNLDVLQLAISARMEYAVSIDELKRRIGEAELPDEIEQNK